MTIRWEAAGATHVGRVRRTNEDAFRVAPERGIFLVADGMGGHAAGEIASALAAEALTDAFIDGDATPTEAALRRAFADAHRRLVACCAEDPATRGMGTTLTVAALDERGSLRIGHIGDSRLYHLHGGQLRQLTRDHTWVQQELDAGRLSAAESRSHPLSHILTRVLSEDEPSDPDVTSTTVHRGDLILLCSDGLHNLVDGQSLLDILMAEQPAADIAERLVANANRRGGTDNITVVVVQIG